MLRQQTEEDKQLWKALAGGQPLSLPVSPTGTGEEIRRVSDILKQEYLDTKRRNCFLLVFWIFIGLGFFVTNSIYKPGEPLEPVGVVVFLTMFLFILIMFVAYVVIKPTARWTNGTLALVSLAKYAPPEEAIRPLLYVASRNFYPNYRKGDVSTLELYQRLAYVLTRLTEFTPDREELRFLKQVVLNSKRYPEPLQIAALLTLGDQPEQLDKTFWTGLESRMKKEQSEAFLAAARDVLSRR